ncbi:MAG: hypothetical protein BMS9Abin26_0601 [Gammaproteobacteria bacterium]|nr:MAG: hypothetical protein BMS9Abin26_0601 [Gammaproteobacteria bacterium]
MIIIAAALSLSGCTAAVVGTAAGGYYVGSDDRTLGEITSDAAITAKVNIKYYNDELVKPIAADINVDTYHNTVYLYGKVSKHVAVRAVSLAQSVSGVKNVVPLFKTDGPENNSTS